MLTDRVEACAKLCIAKAQAAVDPEVRDRIRPMECYANCSKFEMFSGNACP